MNNYEINDTYVMVMMVIAFLFYIDVFAYAIIVPIALWKIFKKAGEKGWKAIIPIYNLVVLDKIIGVSPLFLVLSVVVIFATGLSFGIYSVCTCIIILLVLSIYVNYKLSKALGKKGIFTIGLIIFPFIFYPILGFGKSQYVGINDDSSQNANANMENPNYNSSNMNPNYIEQNQNFNNVTVEKSKNNNKIKKQDVIVLLIILLLTSMMVFAQLGDNFKRRKDLEISESMDEAYELVHGTVKYGQKIFYDDLVEISEIPENITITIRINNKELTNNKAFKFDRIGTYYIEVSIAYSDKHGPQKSNNWKERIFINDKENPVEIGHGSKN